MMKKYTRKQAEIFESKKLIKVSFSCSDSAEFNAIKEQVKAITGRRFDIYFKKSWSVPHTPANVETLTTYGFIFKASKDASPKPTTATKTEPVAEAVVFDKYKDVYIPTEGYSHLYWYQREALQFLEYMDGQGLIALPPGKGKTYVALHHAKMHPERLPILIICPATIKIQWEEQVRAVLPGATTSIISGKTPYMLTPTDVYIINWQMLTYWVDLLKKFNFRIIVGDEIQAIGNEAARTKIVKDENGNPVETTTGTKVTKAYKELLLAQKPGFSHIPMSGTPFGSKVKKFFNILNMLAPTVFPNEWKFKYRYCDPKYSPFGSGKTFNGGSNLEELREKVLKVMYRREKSELNGDALSKQRIVVPMDISSRDKFSEVVTTCFTNPHAMDQKQSQDALKDLQRSAYGFKKSSCIQWIKDFLENEDKLVVYAWHKIVIQDLHTKFKKISVVINGEVSDADKDKAKKKFMKDKKCRLMIINYGSCPGIDGLQSVCNNGAFVECPCVESVLEQAEDRLDRVGQKFQVNIWFLSAAGTIDQRYAELLEKNSKINNTLLKGGAGQEVNILKALEEIDE